MHTLLLARECDRAPVWCVRAKQIWECSCGFISELWTFWVHAGSGPVQPTMFTLAFIQRLGTADRVYSLLCAATTPGKWHLRNRVCLVCFDQFQVQESLQVEVFPVCFWEESLNLNFAARQSSPPKSSNLKRIFYYFWKSNCDGYSIGVVHIHNRQNIPCETCPNLRAVLQLFKTTLAFWNTR